MSDNFSEHTGSFRTVSTSLASQSDRDELLSPALSEVHDRLHQLAIDPNGLEKLDFIFDLSDRESAETLLTELGNGIFPMPSITILNDAQLNGAAGPMQQNAVRFIYQSLRFSKVVSHRES